MRSNNANETITHLAMPERQIPVLIDSSPDKCEGYFTTATASDKPMKSVRRLLPQFIEDIRNPRKRQEIEKEFGPISTVEWNSLRELLALLDRLNAGDWSPIITDNAEEVLKELLTPILRLSPRGWFIDADERKKTGRLILRSASKEGYVVEVDFDLGKATPFENGPRVRNAISKERPVTKADRSSTKLRPTIDATFKTAAFALSQAFTAGLTRTRFVVWWSAVGKKLVPGLYCPDIVTALYALAMWSSGTAGGWAICQRCKKDYPRSRAKQRYCSHKCQVAAAMQRMRDKKRESGPKGPTTSKKRTARR